MRPFRSARTRILASYLVLLAFSTAATVVIIRQILLVRLDNEVQQTLVQETREFRQLVRGRDPETGRPFGDDLRRIFEVFLDRNVPDDDEALVAILDGRIFDTVNGTRFPVGELARSEHWERLRQPKQTEIETASGPARYLAVPVVLDGRLRGHFVVIEFMRGDREEVADAVRIAALVSGSVLLVASLLAFFAAGRVLRPLRDLRDTAHGITETDLSRRIAIEGDDEIAELARTFNDMLDRLQGAFTTQRAFINDASHELRTPITIVRGHLELMGDDPEERRQTVALVTDELDRMSRLVDDLLLLAKAERSDFLRPEPVDVRELVEELLAKARHLGERDWRLDSGSPGSVVADRQRITQALMNLASNAVEHTADGDRIAIGAAAEDASVRLWVADTGPGVAPGDRERIFERFARGGGARRSDGAGLGLAIVRAIAEAHGGSVRLDDTPGGGATFSVLLPRAPAPARPPRAEALA
jgi:signal transduction histidine kinase